jgi:hypothetical protein
VNGNLINTQFFTLEGDLYQQWAGDDNYVIEYIATQLGSSYTPPSA